MRTFRAATLAVAIVVVAGAAGGYAVHRHDDQSTRKAAVKRPTPLPSAPAPRDPVLPQLDTAATRPLAAGVSAALRKSAAALERGAHLVGEVIDARSGDRLWSQDPHQPEPPASTTKLLTAAAALSTLGPDYRLTTTTRRLGRTVYLIGGGDPTIVRAPSSYGATAYPTPATMADLARQTADSLGRTKAVRLRLDSTAWTGPTAAPGWKPLYVTEGDITPPSALEVDEGRVNPRDPFASRTLHPIAQAGSVFAGLLRRNGIRVIGKVSEGRTPATATAAGSVASAPMAGLVHRMLTASDDDLAEAIGRAVAAHAHRPASFAGAARAVVDAVHGLRAPVAGVTLRDTSGLSHDNRIPPRTLVEVLRAATAIGHPELRSMVTGLPVAGLTGTLATRFVDKASRNAAGVLRAKTGTLTGVNALAGLVVDRNGRLLVFAFLASAATPGVTVPALDRLASRLEQCGCDRA
ncbi:MAG: D-alanyl-D-alanine carboxypeptidase/D-alanyl-D-alanine-endopeptidase [Frankiaceae bacterium]|nr:D-alanyl-D-alanine carboxypeptidase/D-alanyl-D-alanine-endopeptidase [Frankiaceae bacterium]